jgi:hypothetical protein
MIGIPGLYSAAIVYVQIPKWVDEYNNYAPHSALEMKTPSKFDSPNCKDELEKS